MPADATQLWIVGAGPAALALADSCVARGVRVGILAPDPRAAWIPNYALWLDDAIELGVEGFLARRWARAEARFAGGPRVLDRGYALLDARRWQLELLARCEAAGVRIETNRLAEISHDDEGVELRCEDTTCLRARLVVDASGHASPFVAREPGGAPYYQVAWGELWAVEGGHPVHREDPMTFMDWTSSGPREAAEELPPTFLYAMPLGDDRLFVEETVLAARLGRAPADYFPALRARLHRRLERSGALTLAGRPQEVERCVIPMGAPLPRGDQRTLAYGGAASMVHPATGYLLTNVLRRRERVADAIARELADWVGPGGPSRRIWQAIWTPEEVRAWRLYSFGLEVIAELDRAGTDRFFAEFFDLPEHCWRGFVSASGPTTELMATMLRYYASTSRPIRGRLSSALLGRRGLRMLRGFAGLER
ncbi:Lycopene beta cyclase [Enhygromyxa salina]|uniref:Lycopene beta cyclase n=1 Tax=Enhygromyxa salina TaxID=215803 RepID=A0A2S9YL11_9BACT|nr:lycopene cyclase family protein [Enhygromyxa salina]PRQ05732.1 Lycopene beta cyclase [Enhygromyxa salina]